MTIMTPASGRPLRRTFHRGRTLAKVAAGLAVLATVSLLPATPAAASGPTGLGTLTLLKTYTSVQYGWQSVQLWNDEYSAWPAQYFLPDGRDNQTGQAQTLFGTGLMQYLSGLGYRVFAVDFANVQGDNYQWAQTIGDALSVVSSQTGVSQVDLLAWSKGAFAARMYVSGVAPSWGRGYQGNVAKLILIGNPNGGLDYTFAHGTEGNPLIYPQCGGSLNGPYYGGTGYVSTSNGIAYAISHGSLVSTILQAGIPATVPTYLLCGGSPTIPEFYNENRGPSDGVVFEASCEETTGIGDVGAVHLIGGDNHLMLGWEPTAESIISSWLS
jgi:hypothetical protein